MKGEDEAEKPGFASRTEWLRQGYTAILHGIVVVDWDILGLRFCARLLLFTCSAEIPK